jgi:hypothetical protein
MEPPRPSADQREHGAADRLGKRWPSFDDLDQIQIGCVKSSVRRQRTHAISRPVFWIRVGFQPARSANGDPGEP